MHAAFQNNMEMVILLMNGKADVAAQDNVSHFIVCLEYDSIKISPITKCVCIVYLYLGW